MNRKIIYYAAVILTIINLAALGTWAYYQLRSEKSESSEGVHSGIQSRRNEQFEQLKSELSLSSGQIIKIQIYRTDFLSQMDSLSMQLGGKRKELANELWQTSPDTARINSLVNQISKVQSEAQRKVIAHLLDVKSTLNSEQQQKFYNIVLQRFGRGSDQPMPNPRLH